MSDNVPISIDARTSVGERISRKTILQLMTGCLDACDSLGKLWCVVKAVKITTLASESTYRIRVTVVGSSKGPEVDKQLEAEVHKFEVRDTNTSQLAKMIDRRIVRLVVDHAIAERDKQHKEFNEWAAMLPDDLLRESTRASSHGISSVRIT